MRVPFVCVCACVCVCVKGLTSCSPGCRQGATLQITKENWEKFRSRTLDGDLGADRISIQALANLEQRCLIPTSPRSLSLFLFRLPASPHIVRAHTAHEHTHTQKQNHTHFNRVLSRAPPLCFVFSPRESPGRVVILYSRTCASDAPEVFPASSLLQGCILSASNRLRIILSFYR